MRIFEEMDVGEMTYCWRLGLNGEMETGSNSDLFRRLKDWFLKRFFIFTAFAIDKF